MGYFCPVMLTEAHKLLFQALAAERLAQIRQARRLAAATFNPAHINVLEAEAHAQVFETAIAELEQIPTRREREAA